MNKQNKSINPFNVSWTAKDVMIVVLCIHFLLFITSGFNTTLLKDNKILSTIIQYIIALVMIFFPLLWIKKKYNLGSEAIGLKRSNYSFSLSIFMGITTGISISVIFFLVYQIIYIDHFTKPLVFQGVFSFWDIAIAPLSFKGFPHFVLIPIGEEIVDRGFIYGFLRKKMGILLSLLFQSLIFTISHPHTFILGSLYNITQIFLMGLILGILYEKTKSLYPSMICHGIMNFCSILLRS